MVRNLSRRLVQVEPSHRGFGLGHPVLNEHMSQLETHRRLNGKRVNGTGILSPVDVRSIRFFRGKKGGVHSRSRSILMQILHLKDNNASH